MLDLKIHLEGYGCWPDLVGKPFIHHTGPMDVALLEGGMKSGARSVAIRIDLADGQTIVAETSLNLFGIAADAMRAKPAALQAQGPTSPPKYEQP